MAFRIATNVASLNTQRWLSVANAGMSKALERLSSGYKINKAADDAAGIAIATKLNVKAASVSKAIDNGNQAIAMLQTAESGIDQIKNILTRLKELATQAASDNVTSEDRTALNTERAQLVDEINKIAQNTKYGSLQLLTGSYDYTGGTNITSANGIANIDVSSAVTYGTTSSSPVNYTLSVSVSGSLVTAKLSYGAGGAGKEQTISFEKPAADTTKTVNFTELGIKITFNSNVTNITNNNTVGVYQTDANLGFQLGDLDEDYDQISVNIANFTTAAGGLFNGLTTGSIDTKSNAQAYLEAIDEAVSDLNEQRGKIGAAQNQISYHVANLEAMYENTRAAESTIKDADFAKEMADFTKFQIVTQSGIAMLAQANQLPQLILSLMR